MSNPIKTQAEIDAENAEAKVQEQLAQIQTAKAALEEREKVGESRAEKKARITQIYDRGIINDRLNVPVPPDVYGEWIRNKPEDIDSMRGLGFEIDTEFVKGRGLHDDSRVADVVFMVTTRENKELIEEVKNERIAARHAKPNRGKEEQDFENLTRQGTQGIIPTITESSVREAKKSTIVEALSAIDAQTTPQGR